MKGSLLVFLRMRMFWSGFVLIEQIFWGSRVDLVFFFIGNHCRHLTLSRTQVYGDSVLLPEHFAIVQGVNGPFTLISLVFDFF